MAQYVWPPISASISIAASGTVGDGVPSAALLVGFEDPSGDLAPGNLDASGNILVSATALPLPTGAATAAKQDTGNTSLASIDGKITACNTGAVVVSSSALPTGAATQATLATLDGKVTACNTGAVVVASSALPTGASTAAKQPALGTAGSASADVISVQGIASMTPLLVNGSGVTQPVSIASAIPTKSPVNTNGQCDNTALTATTATTATAPANAVGFILEAPSDNTHSVRYRIGGTASTTAGMLMEPGRDTGYVPCAANVSVCAITSGTNVFSIQWIMSS